MSANPDTAAPTGRKKLAQSKEHGGPPQEPTTALGHDSQNSPAPTGRNKPAQGNALGHTSQNTPSPEGAKEVGVSHSSRGFDSFGNALPISAITENELPAGWRWVRVKEIGNVQLGRQRAPKHQNGANMRPYLRVANVFEDRIDLSDVKTMNFTPREFETFALRANDILLNEGQSLHLVGRPALYRDDLPGACFQNTLVRFRPGPDVEPKFALTIFRGYMHTGKFQKIARWTTNIAHLGAQRFAEMPFPLPPLPEQRRIVAEIEKQFTRLEAGVAALRRVQANLKRYRAAVLKAACEGRLVPTEAELHRQLTTHNSQLETGAQLLARILTQRRQHWLARRSLGEGGQGRGQYKEPAAPVTTNLQPLPEGWTWATAEQLTDENRAITYGVITLGAPVPDGVHVLRSSDVRHLRLDLEDVKRVSPDIAGEYRRTFLKGGEVLITVRGTLGGVVVAPAECAGFNISREVAMLAMVQPGVAKIAAIFIGSAPLQRWLLQRAKGIAYTGINIETLKELPIPLPPLAEQTRIVAEVERRLSVVEELESVVTANLQRAARLRQSFLQKAFTGKLS